MADNMAKKYLRIAKAKGITLDELKSSARYALCEAAQKFDETKGVKFQTYIYPYIKGQILRDINNIQVFENLDDCLNVVADEQVTNNDEMWETLKNGIDTLTQRERKVIRWKHGIDSEPLTFTEIARKMHLSKDKVMSIHKVAYGKLRKYVNNNKFNKI